MPLEQHPLKM